MTANNTEKAKLRTFDKITTHLSTVVETEPRKRERRRAQIALRNINKFMKESERELRAE